jgi:MurNAc alpha-1-phosphate uridylyltransferase
VKAMILAAGRGKRLQPLTNTTPKPLIKVGKRSLLEQHIHNIAAAKFESIVINIAHLGNMIQQHIGDGSRFGIPIEYSDEGEQALETGGGIANALPLLGDQPFLVVSADIYCEIEFDPNFKLNDALMHLVMVNNPAHNPQGDFDTEEINLVGHHQRLTYSGVGYFQPAQFRNQKKIFPLIESIRLAIEQKKISASLFEGTWHDVGTGCRLHAANKYATSITQK